MIKKIKNKKAASSLLAAMIVATLLATVSYFLFTGASIELDQIRSIMASNEKDSLRSFIKNSVDCTKTKASILNKTNKLLDALGEDIVQPTSPGQYRLGYWNFAITGYSSDTHKVSIEAWSKFKPKINRQVNRIDLFADHGATPLNCM